MHQSRYVTPMGWFGVGVGPVRVSTRGASVGVGPFRAGGSWRNGGSRQPLQPATLPVVIERISVTNDAGEERAGLVRLPYPKRRRKQRYFRVVECGDDILILRDSRDEKLAGMRAGLANLPPDQAYLGTMCVGQVLEASIGEWTDATTAGGNRYSTASTRLTLTDGSSVESVLYVFEG
jgi:hypothetical protein